MTNVTGVCGFPAHHIFHFNNINDKIVDLWAQPPFSWMSGTERVKKPTKQKYAANARKMLFLITDWKHSDTERSTFLIELSSKVEGMTWLEWNSLESLSAKKS